MAVLVALIGVVAIATLLRTTNVGYLTYFLDDLSSSIDPQYGLVAVRVCALSAARAPEERCGCF